MARGHALHTKRSIGPRISKRASDFFSRHFQAENQGYQFILETFPVLYEQTLKEMSGFFTEEEFISLVQFSGGELVVKRVIMAGKVIVSRYEANNNGGHDVPMVLAKLESLSVGQRFCLEVLVNEYRVGKHKDPWYFLRSRGLI